MRYVVLASITYGSGRVMLFTSRLNYRNTGGVGVTDLFIRNCLGWVSQAGDTDRLEVCHVPFETVDGTVPTVDSSFNTSVSRHDVEFLSEDNNLYEFDCIILSGYNNNISPLVRGNLVAYVNSGGGLLVEDFNIFGTVDLFASISPVTVGDAGFTPVDGNIVWTDDGIAHDVFNASFLGLDIGVINTISEDDIGSGWSILNVFDTEAEKSSEIPIEEQLYLKSADFAIKGTYFVGHYTSVYQDGVSIWRHDMSESVEKILNERWAEIVDKPHFVCALGGFKEVGGVDTGEECIVIYVAKKITEESLAPEEILPKKIGGFPTDVREGIPKLVAVDG